MRAVSAKALLIGILAYFAILIVFYVLSVFGVAAVIFLRNIDHNPGSVAAAIKASGPFTSFLLTAMLIPTAVGAGYVAARIAKYNHLIHGALVAGIGIPVDLLARFHLLFTHGGSVQNHPLTFLSFAVTYAGPIFGLLGGYLAQTRQTALVETRGAPGKLSRIWRAARWILACFVAVASYIVVVVLLGHVLGAGVRTTFTFAAAFSVFLATFTVAPDQRKIASFVFIILTIAFPVVGYIRFASIGAASHVYAMLVFLNMAGTTIAYPALWAYRKLST
ncbi:MAG TPA: hypothetical protein VFX37_01015 [Pseudolabrys sp.]|nr:hypothetical protein [Pseudolabrys sp.]